MRRARAGVLLGLAWLCLPLAAEADSGLARCDSLYQAKQFTAAAECARARVDSLDAQGRGDSRQAAEALGLLLRARVTAGGRLDPASASLAERLVELTRRLYGPRSVELARAESRSGDVAERQGRFAAARAAYENSVAIRTAAGLPDDAEMAMSLLGVANVRARLNDFAGLDTLYARALAIAGKSEGPQGALAATVLGNQAIYKKLTGDLPAARALYERSLAIKIALLGEEHAEVARLHYNLGNLLVESGDVDEARENYLKSLAIREKIDGPGSPDVGRSLTALAILEKRAANLLVARDYAERALEIQQKTLPPDHPQGAAALTALAAIQSDLGDLESARKLLEQALAIYTRAYGPDHHMAGGVIAELGWLDQLSGDPVAALASFRRARRIYEAAAPENDRVPAMLNTEAALLAATGRAREGLALAERSVAMRRRSLDPASPALGWSLETLGAGLWETGQFVRADSALSASLAILEQGWGEDHPLYVTAQFDLARVRRARGRGAEALALALDVARGRREALRLTVAGLPERLALSYADRWPRGLDLAITLAGETRPAPAGLARIWSELIRSRALVLDEMAERGRVETASCATAADSLRRVLTEATRELAGLLVQGWQGGEEALASDLRRRSAALRARRELIEQKLTAFDAARPAAALGDTITLAGIAGALPAGMALVGYVRYERALSPDPGDTMAHPDGFARPAYAAFVLPAGRREPTFVDLGSAAEIEQLVRTWRDEAGLGRSVPGRSPAAAEAACRQAGAALRQRIWDPVSRHLAGARSVGLVPDGELTLVSFAALPTAGTRYLIDEDRPLVYLGTERDLAESMRPRAAQGELLAMGAPDFTTTRAPLAFSPLPAAADEIEAIASLWRRARPTAPREALVTLTGAAASEAAFKSLAPRYRALHVATHGFFLAGDRPVPDAGLRGVGGLQVQAAAKGSARTGQQGAPGLEANPMLRSGLVLAGGRGSGPSAIGADDGILTAAEIAVLDLRAVHWVVLSACESGVGATSASEGVFGLRRAFRIAGARDLVISLWPLSDQLMRDWMLQLYDAHLSHGVDLIAASWQASRAVLAQRRAAGLDTHPQVWAGFVACGD